MPVYSLFLCMASFIVLQACQVGRYTTVSGADSPPHCGGATCQWPCLLSPGG
jgi:hypothetical protein